MKDLYFIFNEGRDATFDDENPYEAETDQAKAWIFGWLNALDSFKKLVEPTP